MAALLGALPLAIGMGEGGEFRQPLGIAIVGGLILSQVLTLYTTPVIYLYLDRFRLWSQRLEAAARHRWRPTPRCNRASRCQAPASVQPAASPMPRPGSRRAQPAQRTARGVRAALRSLLSPGLSGCILGTERPELNLDCPAAYREAPQRARRCRRSGAGLVARLPLQRTDRADGSGADLQSRYRGRDRPDRPGRRAGRRLRRAAVAVADGNGAAPSADAAQRIGGSGQRRRRLDVLAVTISASPRATWSTSGARTARRSTRPRKARRSRATIAKS